MNQTLPGFNIIKKSSFCWLTLLISLPLLAGCAGIPAYKLAQHFNSRQAAVTMPYDRPRYLVQAVPDQLPFAFSAVPIGELLGTVETDQHESGTILQTVDQSRREILDFYTHNFAQAAFSNTNESYSYQVFFPPEETGATFCSPQGVAVILEIFDSEGGSKDVRLHYTVDNEVIERTTCGQPILVIGDFPFPHLAAPPNSSVVGGGGGGGGSGKGTRQGTMGYAAEVLINSEDSLEYVYKHYVDLLTSEGWTLLDESSTGHAYESSWDFGFYETRSWLGRLAASVGEAPNQYKVELRAISP